MLNVIAAPGPVSYPMVAASSKYKDITIDFGKEGKADVILDSTVSLVKRGVRIDYITIKGLMVVSPDVGRKIGVWRRGSAADVLTKALFHKKGINGEIVYAEDMQKLMELLNQRQVESVVVPAPFGRGKTFEELLNVPGSCGASILANHEEFVRAYSEGIDLMKEDPQGTAEYIASRLPVQANKKMIVDLPRVTTLGVMKMDKYDEFENLVKRFL
ncbi:DUF3834 domain-containing protein [Metallosphaera tengchongensis]|uniref:DUF3834 domain-containing protein n=2 Tax=Metallosphaera tengchongensis TaxID=1532350 RepID=A0A6N0NVX5_9CREN|nr:DUF3834 domain-containing protein [Metallosphaera tengchongensis]